MQASFQSILKNVILDARFNHQQQQGSDIMRTITFNTGRTYNGEQVITASSVDGRVITFNDPSRGLEYTFRNNPEWFTEEDLEIFGDWDERAVMSWYDGDRTNRPEV